MARPIPCDTGDGELAALIITNPENGEVNGFCVAHFCDFAQAFLTQFRPEALAAAPARGRGKKTAAPAPAVADDSKGGDTVADSAPAESRTA